MYFLAYIFSITHNDNTYEVIKQHCNVSVPKKPYTLAGFKPGTFCSVGGPLCHAARAR
jgi:hypothetical protein